MIDYMVNQNEFKVGKIEKGIKAVTKGIQKPK